MSHPPEIPSESEHSIKSESGNSSDDESHYEMTTQSEQDGYEHIDTVPVICDMVDAQACIQIAQGYCLRIPRGALDVPKGKKCFVSVTPQQTACLEITGHGHQGLNAQGAYAVDCRSFNYRKPLAEPLQLEIPHCAIIGDLDKCTVKFWHKNVLDDNAQWREVLQDNYAIYCRVKQRCVQITDLHMGTYAILLDGEGVKGKTMQMAVFGRTKSFMDSAVGEAHIYLFNSMGSDSVWMDIEDREYKDGSILCDVSGSFSVYRDDGDLSLSFYDLQDLELSSGQLDTMDVPDTAMWQSPFIKLTAQFTFTCPPEQLTGSANITLRQSGSSHGKGLEEMVTFSFSDEHAGIYTTIADIREKMFIDDLPTGSLLAGATTSESQDFDADYIDFKSYPKPTRSASSRDEAQRRQTIRRQQFNLIRSRMSPLARTTPNRVSPLSRSSSKQSTLTRGANSRGSISRATPSRRGRFAKQSAKAGSVSGDGSSEASTSETSSDGGPGGTAATVGASDTSRGTVIPQRLKEELSELLQGGQFGNDWTMLVTYIGLDHLLHRFIGESHPMMAVLDCCEQLDIDLPYLESAMKDIDRYDAATLIKFYIPSDENGSQAGDDLG